MFKTTPPSPSDDIFVKSLMDIADMLAFWGKSLQDFNLPISPTMSSIDISTREYLFETAYDKDKLMNRCLIKCNKFNKDQQKVFKRIMDSVTNKCSQNFFYLNAPAGTGKTFLCNALLDAVRGKGHIALACATTGIASILLYGARTLHSRFKIPLVISENLNLKIEPTSTIARLMRECKLLI